MLPTENKNPTHKPFFIPLCIGYLVLHNCMFDSGASTNVLPLAVMKRLGLQVSRSYRNLCALDSREVKVCGVVMDVPVQPTVHPSISINMDIVVIDLPESWGMLLSRKFGADLGGSLHMDLSYATIPTPEGGYINLQREMMRKHHVEDPMEQENEYI